MRSRTPTLELLVFVVGTSTLGAEIAAARLMAPFFGDSTIVWANTIAIVLVALSIGYWFGGRLADRHPHLRGLCLLVLAASLILGLVPIVANPFLSLSVDAFDSVSIGTFAGSLFGVLALVAIPVLMLGAVSPWAIRLKLHAVEDSGEVAGRMYAISTVGSLVGTFLAALLLIPLVGTQRTFLVFALALALVAALGLGAALAARAGRGRAAAGDPARRDQGQRRGPRDLRDRDRVPVRARRRVPRRAAPAGAQRGPGDPLDLPARVAGSPATTGTGCSSTRSPRSSASRASVAMLGTAAGTTVRQYARFLPDTQVDAVEIDGELLDIGRRYFDLEDRPQLSKIAEDARPFLRRSDGGYDVIMVDAYRQPYIPFYLTTKEFFELARARLAPGGVVAINVGHPEGSDRLERVLSATLRSAFAYVARDPLNDTNTILMGSDAPLTGGRLLDASRSLPDGPAPGRAARGRPPAPGPDGGRVYTDDHAPVEWLVDESLVEYAAGE